MRSELVHRRYKDVLRMDSINSTQGDFLVTHIPFRKMSVLRGRGMTQSVQEVQEEDVFQSIFGSSVMLDQHQLIIVEGSSGAGKSHFIRWIHARLMNMENPDEVILLIRRSDNTLKGTIKQLLEIDEVKHIQNREVYERLVKANQTISEQKLKNQIFHRFLAEIQSDEGEDSDKSLTASRRKGLYQLLSDSNFEEKMLYSGGPIERIFNKVTTSETGTKQDAVALFEPEDFILSADFVEDMINGGANKKAVKTANRLIPDEDGKAALAEEIADYMNGHVEEVIQSCAGIEPGDFQQIFKEIRQELKRLGKRLTLLIEDITSFTGINQALLNVLITEHTGLNEADKLCRLVSVVGTTTEYYKQFRDNYKDRITTQITISDEAFGKTELQLFVAKYLNAMSLDPEVIEEWVKNGAREEDYPVHTVTEGAYWDSVSYQNKRLNLYPFTKNAVSKFYAHMGLIKTPRYILRDIVEPAVNDILFNKKGFPAFCKNARPGLPEQVDMRIRNVVNQLTIPEEQKAEFCERILYLVGIWGDGTLDSANGMLAGLSLELYRELGLDIFADKLYDSNSSASSNLAQNGMVELHTSTVRNDIVPTITKGQEKYNTFYDMVTRWHYNDGILTEQIETVRTAIEQYIMSAINWQQEEVSIQTISFIEDSSKRIIGFERQSRGIDKALVLLDNSPENYQLLLAFGKWQHLGSKSWDFESVESAIYAVTTWLMHYKQKLIQAMRGIVIDNIPLYLKCAMIAEMYRKLLNKEYTGQSLNQVDATIWFQEKKPRNGYGHCQEWQKTLEWLYDSAQVDKAYELTRGYFNLIQGTNKNARTYILKYTAFRRALQQLRKSKLVLTDNERNQKDGVAPKDEMMGYLTKLLPKLDAAAQGEVNASKQIVSELLSYYNFDEDDEIETADIRDLLTEIQGFYKDTEFYGVNIDYQNEQADVLQKKAGELANAIAVLQKDYSKSSTLDIILQFSTAPIGTVKPFLDLLKKVDEHIDDVKEKKSNEKSSLTRAGGWAEQTDPRFEEYQKGFDLLLREYEEATV